MTQHPSMASNLIVRCCRNYRETGTSVPPTCFHLSEKLAGQGPFWPTLYDPHEGIYNLAHTYVLTCKIWLLHLLVWLLWRYCPDCRLVVQSKGWTIEELWRSPTQLLNQHHSGWHLREGNQSVGHLTGSHPQAVKVRSLVVTHQILLQKLRTQPIQICLSDMKRVVVSVLQALTLRAGIVTTNTIFFCLFFTVDSILEPKARRRLKCSWNSLGEVDVHEKIAVRN